MAIKKESGTFDKIISANCDCCGNAIKKGLRGELEDHVLINGSKNGKLLSAVICISCTETKLSFIKIAEKENTIGFC